MAYIIDIESNSASPAVVGDAYIEMPEHSENDILLVFIRCDYAVTPTPQDASWQLLYASSTGSRIFWKIATSSTEDDFVVGTITPGKPYYLAALSVRDADVSDPFNVIDDSYYSGVTCTSPEVTTTIDDCLLLYAVNSDKGHTDIAVAGQATHIATASSWSFRYIQQFTAAVAPSVISKCTVSRNGYAYVLAIRNAGDGARSCNFHDTFSTMHYYAFDTKKTYSQHEFPWFTGILEYPVSVIPVTIGQTSYNCTDFSGSKVIAGMWEELPTVLDMSGKTYSVAISGYQLAYRSFGDIYIVLADSMGNWNAYSIGNKLKYSSNGVYFNITISPDNSIVADSSGVVDPTDIAYIGFFHVRYSSDTGGNGLYFQTSTLNTVTTIVGGGENNPISPADLHKALDYDYYIDHVLLQGSGQCLIHVPVQFGDGIMPSYIDFARISLETPIEYSYRDSPFYNVVDYGTSITIKLSDVDVLSARNCTIVANTPNYFTIHEDSSLLAEYIFSGAVVVGWVVTWKTGVPCIGGTFADGSMDAKGASMENCAFSNIPVTVSNGFTSDGCSFLSADGGYGLIIGSSADITLSDTSFSGFDYDINVTAVTGVVNINLAVGQEAPSYQTAGATVNVIAPTIRVSVVVDGLMPDTRLLVVRDNGDGFYIDDEYTLSGLHAETLSIVSINETIKIDTPDSGIIRVGGLPYAYSSFDTATKTFTLTTTLGQEFLDGSVCFVPFIDTLTDGVEESSAVFSFIAPFKARIFARKGSSPDSRQPFESTFMVTASGGSITAILNEDK